MTTIDVAAILHELHRSQEGKADATAATLTLIAYCDDDATIDRMRERLRALGQKYSARVIMLDGTTRTLSRDDVHAGTTAAAPSPSRAEWIELGAHGVGPATLAAAAHALTVRDVPSVLAWGGRTLLRNPAFASLAQCVDSLIFDSSRREPDALALRELCEYFAQGTRGLVQDLAYLRLAPWQEMIAQFFDDNDLAGEVHALRRVSILAGSQSEAFYLVGWLASRLGWRPTGKDTFHGSAGERITYDLRMQGEPRRVRSVELESKSATVFRAELLEEDETTVCLSVNGPTTRPRRCEPIRNVSIVELLERSVLMPKTTDIYRSALEATRDILNIAMA